MTSLSVGPLKGRPRQEAGFPELYVSSKPAVLLWRQKKYFLLLFNYFSHDTLLRKQKDNQQTLHKDFYDHKLNTLY